MGKYTAYGKNIDKEIQRQLDKILEVIKKFVSPVSVILIGGFGRGEGSVIYKKNKFIPINDYDIYAITAKKYPAEIIEEMCKQASESIGKKCIDFYDYSKDMGYDIEKTFYPDIRVLTLTQIKKLPPFLKYFELRNSTVIYGKGILWQIPNFNINQVPDSEGFRFLMNRISLMIMHIPHSALKNPSKKDKERIINFNMKTALSCAEALLFYSKKFTPSYKQRAETIKKTFKKDFPELHNKIPELPNLIDRYTKQKLKPDYDSINNFADDWFILRDYAAEILKFLLVKFTGKKADNITELAQIMNKVYPVHYIKEYVKAKFKIKNNFFASILAIPSNLILNIFYLMRVSKIKKQFFINPLKHPFIPPDLKIFPAAILFIFSLEKSGKINRRLFNKARGYFNQIYPDSPKDYKNYNWEEMRRDFGTAFNIYGFQKLI